MSSEGGTARGDRNQRRIDVLNAATQILDESGWAGLNMREVAARAGVSAGATYQWFSGKDEIYAELYSDRLAAGVEALEATPPDIGLEDLLIGTFAWVASTWRVLGRWQLEFAEISRDREPSDAVAKLAETHQRLLQRGLELVARAAAAEGRRAPVDIDTAHLIWGTATGLAMRADVLQLDDARAEALQRAAVRALVTGLFETT